MFPLMVDLSDRLVLVVGGGPVGQRKARSLLDAGAIVRLVCLEPQPAEFAAPRLIWLPEPYTADHLAGVSLGFACASPNINRVVVADARRRGVWVNRADDPAGGDVVLPAILRRGEFLVAVATGGSAPAFAKRVRDELESRFDECYGEWVALLKSMRPLVQSQIGDPSLRRELLERWCDPDWLERLRRNGREKVAAMLHEELRAAADG